MKNIGVAGPDSSKETAKSSVLPITYLLPSFSSTKSLQEEYDSVLLNTVLLSLTDKLHSCNSSVAVTYTDSRVQENINFSHDAAVTDASQSPAFFEGLI